MVVSLFELRIFSQHGTAHTAPVATQTEMHVPCITGHWSVNLPRT